MLQYLVNRFSTQAGGGGAAAVTFIHFIDSGFFCSGKSETDSQAFDI